MNRYINQLVYIFSKMEIEIFLFDIDSQNVKLLASSFLGGMIIPISICSQSFSQESVMKLFLL